jgi:hypothetical protein
MVGVDGRKFRRETMSGSSVTLARKSRLAFHRTRDKFHIVIGAITATLHRAREGRNAKYFAVEFGSAGLSGVMYVSRLEFKVIWRAFDQSRLVSSLLQGFLIY